jgi:hypothetical protein
LAKSDNDLARYLKRNDDNDNDNDDDDDEEEVVENDETSQKWTKLRKSRHFQIGHINEICHTTIE